MGAFLVKRLMFSVVTLFAVLTLVFIVVRIVPGDPAQVILGDQAWRLVPQGGQDGCRHQWPEDPYRWLCW